MDCEVWTTCCDSEDDPNEEADAFMGAAGTGNISEGNAPPDIKPPASKKQKIEAVKQDPVTRENTVKPAKAFQGEISSASFFSLVLNLRGSKVQKKKPKKNLIKDGPGQAPNLVKKSERPQKSPVPNTSQAHLNPSSKTRLLSIKQQLSYYAHLAKQRTVHTGLAANHCTACNVTFKTPSDLKLHRHKAHSTEYTFKCPECEKSFLSPGSVIQHRNAMHNHLNQSSQTAVKQFFSNDTNMAKHQAVPTGVAANHCTACNMTFKTPAGLKLHRHKAHNTENTFKCPECEKSFPSTGSVTQHRNAIHTHLNQSSQIVIKNFLSYYSNMAKLRAVPTGVAVNHCTACNMTFKTPAGLKRHRHEAHSTEDSFRETFSCPECDKPFPSLGPMTQHRSAMHNYVKKSSPTAVKQSVSQSSNMAKHQAVPTGVAANHCTECNKTFKSPGHLNRHSRRAHSTEDTFKCPECDKPFLGPGSVTQHRIVMHDVRNIYQCSICNIIVKSAAILNQHHRITHS